jgi:hypothetical protein
MRFLRRLASALLPRLMILIVVGIIVVAGIMLREQLGGAAAELRAGDCFDLPGEAQDFIDVQHRPCGESHDAEVFAIVSYPPGDAYPSEAEMGAFLAQECIPAFKAYTGLDADADSSVGISALIPTPEGWGSGKRDFTCYLLARDGSPLIGSRQADVH